MGSQSVTKAVAKKLKYYVDIKRREDAFDLTGPYLPPQEPMPHRPGPTLAYDGIHDRSLKHYFRDPEVKQKVGKMTTSSGKAYRENEIRQILDVEMSKRNYKLTSDPESPYLSGVRKQSAPVRRRPRALISVDEYLKTKKGSKQRKVKPDSIGKPRKAVRRSPPHFVSKNEHERLVNMAARLIAATETSALPGNRYSRTAGETSTCDSSQIDLQSYTGESSDTEISARRHPRPPSRAGHPLTRWTPPRASSADAGVHKKTSSKSSNNSVQSDTSDYRNLQVSHRKGSKKKESVSPYQQGPAKDGKSVRKKPLEPSLQHPPYRPHSARYGKTSKNNGYINDKKMVNSYMASSEDERNMANNDQRLFYKRSPKLNGVRIRTLTYEVYIVTGDCRGAGTEADIKLTLFGEHGSSGERPLLKSMNHPRRFCRGQVDIFPIDSLYLGELHNIRIGHTKTSPEHGWFLEKIYISEGKKENRVFEFSCQRWFSAQKDDGQIVRDVSVSELISEPELNNKIDEYTSQALGSSDDESDASYSSESSDDKKQRYSSDRDSQTSENNRKGSPKASQKERTGKHHETRKKTVSFEGENTKKEHDSDDHDDVTKNSEDEYASSLEKSDYSSSDTEDENAGKRSGSEKSPSEVSDDEERKKNSEVKNSEGINSDDKNSKGKSSEEKGSDRQSEEKIFIDKNSKKENVLKKDSERKSSKEESSEKRKEEDFWSAGSDKCEPIHYDLGVKDEETREKDDSDHSSSPESSPNSSLTSLKHDKVEDGKESAKEKRVDNETDSKDEQESADKQSNQESVKTDVKSDEESNKDYMAGFLAGVRATEHEKEMHKEDEQASDNYEDDEDDEEYIMRKGPSLHVAVSTGDTDRVHELIQHNPSLKDQTDEKGWIPLHVGCASGQLECVKLIAVSGGNLEQETPTGYTSMHLAAMNGHVNCMMVLFALGAEISCRTIDEYTPLHLAAMSGHVECVKWLLANRARHDVKDVNDRTPGDIAEEYCYEDVAKLLKSFKKELTRTDSTLSHLLTYEGKRRKSTESVTSETVDSSKKVTDNDEEVLENDQENWVSDNDDDDNDDDDVQDKEASSTSAQRPPSGLRPASGGRPGSGRRPGSARSDDGVNAMNRTDSIMTKEEKKKLYEKQRKQMKKRNSSFLDSIRMDVEDDFNGNF
ncbi:uncharacterized protein LOC114519182 [Dendronephthya gigantea]|uniref:uncharacterized protein LOC114519182 n=1 Tax=Dendronephthya gigantea TaxID=151771 RepID=UPI00106CEDEA|nr:uncharacterized protein LOC114519182 [Dendronephthya gigantea]